MTFIADIVAPRLDEFEHRRLSVVESAVRMHPWRWRFVLREALASAEPGQGMVAGEFLEQVGDRSDVARLRYIRQKAPQVASSFSSSDAPWLGDWRTEHWSRIKDGSR